MFWRSKCAYFKLSGRCGINGRLWAEGSAFFCKVYNVICSYMTKNYVFVPHSGDCKFFLCFSFILLTLFDSFLVPLPVRQFVDHPYLLIWVRIGLYPW